MTIQFKTKENFLEKYCKENPLKSLGVVIFCSGILILTMFFVEIGFAPTFNFETLSSAVVCSAIVGMAFVFSLLFLLVLPGVLLRTSIGHFEGLARGELIFTGIFILIVTTLAQLFVLHEGSVDAFLKQNKNILDNAIKLIPALSMPTAITANYFINILDRSKFKTHLSSALSLIGLIYPALFPLAVVIILDNNHSIHKLENPTTLISTLFVINAINLAFGVTPQRKLKKFGYLKVLAIALLLLGLVFNVGSSYDVVPKSTVRILGLGNVSGEYITLKNDHCHSISKYFHSTECSHKNFTLNKVRIVSRIGAEFLIEICVKNTPHRIVIEKSNVVDWEKSIDNKYTDPVLEKNKLTCSYETTYFKETP